MKQRKLEQDRRAEEEREAKLAKESGHSSFDATTLPLEDMEGLSMAEQILLAEMSAAPCDVDEAAALQAALVPMHQDDLDCMPLRQDDLDYASMEYASMDYRKAASASRPALPA